MNIDQARSHCLDLIKSTTTKPAKKFALLRDIESAPTPVELSRIMWNVLLAGEGLITVDSSWQKTYGK
jgi:hypothetical protein